MQNPKIKSRRSYLRGLALGLAGAIAGCMNSSETTQRTIVVEGGPPCAEEFRILEQSARFGSGTVPEITFQIENTGKNRIRYELTVTFQQATSTGKDIRIGQSILSGTLSPMSSVVRTATDDTYEIENTDSYEVDTSVSCLE